MTIETVLIIIGLCLAACYVVFEYQKAAIPPYQEPVAPEPVAPEPVAPEPVAPEPDLSEQWVKATKADTLDNIDKWNAKVGDKIWYKPDDGALTEAQVAQIKETVVVPQAVWPFPQGPKP